MGNNVLITFNLMNKNNLYSVIINFTIMFILFYHIKVILKLVCMNIKTKPN